MSWNTQGYQPANNSQSGADQQGSGLDQSPQQEELTIPRIIFYTRVLNLVLGICMIVAAMLSLLTTASMTTAVLCCYVVVFACLLCCFESGLQVVLRMIALNFGFMYSAKARSLFMIFVGSILFSFSLFGKIVGCCMLANAAFNIFAIIKYPGYEEAQRDRSTSEIKDYLKENPAFAKTFVDAGTSFIAANPALALSAAQGAMSAGMSRAEAGQAEQQQQQQQQQQQGGYVAPQQDPQGSSQFANQF